MAKIQYTKSREFGPIFGRGHDLLIFNKFNVDYESYSSLGNCYGVNEDYSPYTCDTFLAGKRNFKIKEMEIYSVKYFE